MSKGIAKATYLGKQGQVAHTNAPNWDFIYETSKVKNPNYNIGDRVVLPDGRIFHYAKSSGVCYPGLGCVFADTAVATRTTAGVSQAVGDKEVTHPVATHDAFTEDELRGGYVIIGIGAANRGDIQVRGIIGNAATAADVAFKIYLDGALTTKVTAGTSDILAYKNPYSSLYQSTGDNRAKAGLPAATVSAADMYFWVQKAGFSTLSPQIGVDGRDIGCCWRYDGSLTNIGTGYDGTIPGDNNTQYAGYCVGSNYNNKKPLFMLNG